VKFVHVLARIALVSVAAAALVGLTELYGHSVRVPLPYLVGQAERQHRASGPKVSEFPEFIGYVFLFVFWGVIGRTALRLRLSHASRGETQPISLGLHRGAMTSKAPAMRPPERNSPPAHFHFAK